jgi:DNA primase catalytic subunit
VRWLDWLRKLGILRFGAKKYHYTSGRDMPAEAFMDDVSDAKKDLLFDIDLNEKRVETPSKEPEKGVKMWKKILGGLLVLIVIAVIAIL